MLYGVSNFYLVQAFYLALRPNRLLWAYAPASLATLVLNIALVPFFGLWGAVASAGISQIMLMVGLLCCWQARVFAARAARGRSNCSGDRCMSALIYWINAPVTWPGLFLQIITGCLVYGLMVLGLFRAEIRSWISPLA